MARKIRLINQGDVEWSNHYLDKDGVEWLEAEFHHSAEFEGQVCFICKEALPMNCRGWVIPERDQYCCDHHTIRR